MHGLTRNLSDDVVRLEPLGERHLEGLAAMGRDPEVQRFTRVPSPWEEGFERTWLSGYEEGHRVGTRAGFAIIDPVSGESLGLAALVQIEADERQAEAGYIVAPQARGRGIAGRALGLLTDWALNDLGLERVELRIAVENAPSLRVAERAGFVREGVLRSLHVKQDERADVVILSRLRTDARLSDRS